VVFAVLPPFLSHCSLFDTLSGDLFVCYGFPFYNVLLAFPFQPILSVFSPSYGSSLSRLTSHQFSSQLIPQHFFPGPPVVVFSKPASPFSPLTIEDFPLLHFSLFPYLSRLFFVLSRPCNSSLLLTSAHSVAPV